MSKKLPSFWGHFLPGNKKFDNLCLLGLKINNKNSLCTLLMDQTLITPHGPHLWFLPWIKHVNGRMNFRKVWSIFWLVLPAPQHQLVHLIGGTLGGRHPIPWVQHLTSPCVGHSLIETICKNKKENTNKWTKFFSFNWLTPFTVQKTTNLTF